MAHFAEIDENNLVTRVIVVNDSDCLDADGNESEAVGRAFCSSLLGGNWVQTSYNKKIRKNYAGIGFTYNEGLDAFVPPKPFASWVLNEDTCDWTAPVPMPDDGKLYYWNEEQDSWVALQPHE